MNEKSEIFETQDPKGFEIVEGDDYTLAEDGETLLDKASQLAIVATEANLSGVGSKVPITWHMVEITQDCSKGWTPDVVSAFVKWKVIKDFAWILHDKDLKHDNKSPRDPHIHCLVRFHNSTKTANILKKIASFGVVMPPNFLNRIRSWNAALNYLTHRDVEDAPYKHIYEASEVHSNFEWEDAADAAHEKKGLKISKSRRKEIVDAIISGDIMRYNMHEYITAWEFSQVSKEIDAAFRYADRLALVALDSGPAPSVTNVFISGPAGIGKDFLAEALCRNSGRSFYRCAASSDFLSDYLDQPALIVSDARDSLMTFNHMLQFLDPSRRALVHSRYRNKLLRHDLCIFTSVVPPSDWYRNHASRNRSDSLNQFYRRISYYIKIRSATDTPDASGNSSRFYTFDVYKYDRDSVARFPFVLSETCHLFVRMPFPFEPFRCSDVPDIVLPSSTRIIHDANHNPVEIPSNASFDDLLRGFKS